MLRFDIRDDQGKEYYNIPELRLELGNYYELAVVGFDFEDNGGFEKFKDPKSNCKPLHIGKLSSLNYKHPTYRKIVNQLIHYNWDFPNYPDPTILLIEIEKL